MRRIGYGRKDVVEEKDNTERYTTRHALSTTPNAHRTRAEMGTEEGGLHYQHMESKYFSVPLSTRLNPIPGYQYKRSCRNKHNQ